MQGCAKYYSVKILFQLYYCNTIIRRPSATWVILQLSKIGVILVKSKSVIKIFIVGIHLNNKQTVQRRKANRQNIAKCGKEGKQYRQILFLRLLQYSIKQVRHKRDNHNKIDIKTQAIRLGSFDVLHSHLEATTHRSA